jgi:hypothetical protein
MSINHLCVWRVWAAGDAMTLYIPKPGTWFLPFVPVRCIERYDDVSKAFSNSGLFDGWVWSNGKLRRDEEVCPLDEFWIITL